ncbi:MAG: GNAT family N-acetyltransferase [Saprospiraceae bacterium]|nr:GNAT family N-acetyltransferase [Saprospiraceae bacterium]
MRPLHPDDAPYFFQLNTDPLVIRYTGDDPFHDEASARLFLLGYDQFTRFRMGRMAMIRNSDLAWLGWCGLRWDEASREVDLGFRVFRQYWGQGYATEAAFASLEYGWSIGLQRIIGRAVVNNIASIRVLEKVGMKEIAKMDFHGLPGVVYEVLSRGNGE